MPNSYIDRVGSYMPEEWIVSNEKFIKDYVGSKKGRIYSLNLNGTDTYKEVDISDEWIKNAVGIEQRYFSPIDMDISQINSKSVEGMINNDEEYKNSIEGIINAGVTGPGNYMTFPSHAAQFQLKANLVNIKWAFDVATPFNSYETANSIVHALNSHQPGVYIAIFSNTREDIANPKYQTKLFGKVTGIELYKNGKPDTGINNYSHGLKPPEQLENVEWEKDDRYIEQEYGRLAQIIRDEIKESHINPEDVKGIFVINQTQKNSPIVKTNSYVIKEKLKLNDLRWCFDIAAACATTQLAFALTDGIMPLAHDGKRMVVSVGESLEKITDIYHEGKELSHKNYMDANNVLFGTANACFGIARSYDDRGFVHFDGISDPFDNKNLWITKNSDGHIYMPAGKSVFKTAVNDLSKMIIDKVKLLGWNGYDIEHHTHNANARIFEGIGKNVHDAGINGEFIKNIHRIANASAGSCAKMTADRYPYITIVKKKIINVALGSGLQETFMAMQS
ncbi:MAG: hypothetical protein ACP5NV_06170 [Candidatus Woesearchaeota archaeon]